MKRVLVPSILIATVLTGGVLAYVILKASPVSSQEFLDSGRKYFEEQKYSEALIQLLNAVQRDARNRDARYLLALTYLTQKDFGAAAQQFRALLEYYPDDVDANLRLGNIYLAAGPSDSHLFRQASDLAQKVLSKEPENVPALILLGNASAGLQDYTSSVEMFEKAVSLDPQNIPAFVSLGTTQVLQRNFAEAEQAFLKALQANPKDRSALLSLGNYYRALRQTEKAEATFKDALSQYPSDRNIYVQLVSLYYEAGRFDEAEKVLRDAQARSAQDPKPSLLLADFYLARNRRADARKELFDAKERFPQSLDVAVKLALNLLQSEPERARTEIDEILKADPRSAVGQILLGELHFTTNNLEAAEASFGKEEVLNSPYPQPHFFLGSIALRKGQVEQAQDHYQKALERNGRYLPARVALAELLLNKGRLGDARSEIGKALNVQPNFVPARILKAVLDRTEKNYPEAERELAALLKEQPNNPLIHRQMGYYADSRGRKTEAEKSLMRALELQPESQETLRDLTRFYMLAKQPEKALQTINSVPDEKRQAFHYELMGLVYSQNGKRQEAEAAYKKALEKDPNRRSSDVYLAAQYIQSGRLEDGLKKLDELIAKNPLDSSAYGTKGLIYETQGNRNEAKRNYEEALKIDPNMESAANNLAYMLAEEGRDLDSALGWAQLARKKKPENPSIADTLGWVYYKRGDFVLARDQLLFAISKQPDNPVFFYHLGMIYKETRQIREAQNAFRKAIGSSIDFKEKSLAQAALKDLSQ